MVPFLRVSSSSNCTIPAARATTHVESHPTASPSITATNAQYPQIGSMLPAAGYAPAQLAALADTINTVDADVLMTSTLAGAVTIRLSQFSCTPIANVTGKTARTRYS